MSIEQMKEIVGRFVEKYAIIRITLFGSRAAGNNHPDSDVDLIVEFSKPISLLTLSSLKLDLEEQMQLKVDVIHGPVREDDMIEVNHEVVLYAA